MKTKTNFPFKRLDLGDKFSHGGLTYRKISDKKAVRLTESGRGLTNSPTVFSRSTDVVLVDPARPSWPRAVRG